MTGILYTPEILFTPKASRGERLANQQILGWISPAANTNTPRSKLTAKEKWSVQPKSRSSIDVYSQFGGQCRESARSTRPQIDTNPFHQPHQPSTNFPHPSPCPPPRTQEPARLFFFFFKLLKQPVFSVRGVSEEGNEKGGERAQLMTGSYASVSLLMSFLGESDRA